MSSLQARTIAECRELGRITGIVERYVPGAVNNGAGYRSDLFGSFDLVSIDQKEHCIVGIQVSDSGSRLAHLRKFGAEPQRTKLLAWLAVGGRIELWCWSLRKLKRNSKAVRWCGTVYEINEREVKRTRIV